MIFFLGIVVIVILLIILPLKFGKKKALSFATKIISPSCIILFYLSNISIVLPILNYFHITDEAIFNTPSMRVAVDSAIVTLLVNVVLEFLTTPLKVMVYCRTPDDVEQVVINEKINRKIDYIVQVDFAKKWIKKLYKRFGGIYLNVINSKYTSIAIDKEMEYVGIINTEELSKYASLDLCRISDSSQTCNKLYFTLCVLSNKTIEWEDIIECKLQIKNKLLSKLTMILWEVQQKPVKVVHRKDKND